MCTRTMHKSIITERYNAHWTQIVMLLGDHNPLEELSISSTHIGELKSLELKKLYGVPVLWYRKKLLIFEQALELP